MAGSLKLQPDDRPRYSLGIRLSSDDAVGSRWKFARRFAKGIRKLVGNAKGDRREEDEDLPQDYRKLPDYAGWMPVYLKKKDSKVDVGYWRRTTIKL
ncbi:hypothetical protein BHM03_00058239 [Ensete ventricosum]|nr:hypothetical protein BHM03_00058239 [Ensete ventricosum]